MKVLNSKKIGIMKKQMVFLMCLMIVTTNAFAQKNVGKTCADSLKDVRSTLRTTDKQLKESVQVLRQTEVTLQEMKSTLEETQSELEETKFSLKKAQSALEEARSASQKFQGTSGITDEQYQELEEKLEKTKKEKQKTDENLQNVKKELEKTKDALTDAEKKSSKLEENILKTRRTFPFIVTNVQFKNTGKKGKIINDYDENLSGIKCLTVQILYNSLLNEPKNVDLKIRIYKLNKNELWVNSKDFSDYTIKTNVYIGAGEGKITLNEWEKKGKSIFPSDKLKSGRYRIEIWHDNVCLGQKTFTVN